MTAACLAAYGTIACAPVFNWRDVTIDATSLDTLFPCKPEKESRKVVLGAIETDLSMTHCDTAGITFAVGHVRISDPALADPVLAQWRNATLASMRVSTSRFAAWNMELASIRSQAVSVDATGTGNDGKHVALKAAWFGRDRELYVALIYGPAWSSDVADAFFTGLRFR
jgi:hypothetical protein